MELPGDVLREKFLEEKASLQLIEFTSDIIEPGAKYRLLRLNQDNLLRQYPAGPGSFEKQKDLEGVERLYDNIFSIEDFDRIYSGNIDTELI